MSETTFTITLPDEVLAAFGWNPDEVPERVREFLIMMLLRQNKLSEAEAASLLGLNRWELIDVMGAYRVPAITMSIDELRQELNPKMLFDSGKPELPQGNDT